MLQLIDLLSNRVLSLLGLDDIIKLSLADDAVKNQCGSVEIKRTITVALIKSMWLHGIPKIDDHFSDKTNVDVWYSGNWWPMQWKKKTVWLHGIQNLIRVDFCVRGDKTNAMWLYGIQKLKTVAVMKLVWLYGAQNTDDRCSKLIAWYPTNRWTLQWRKQCGCMALEKAITVAVTKHCRYMLFKKSMMIVVIKIVWFYCTL